MRRWLGRYVAVALLLVACVASLGCEQDTGGTPCGEPICFEPNVRVNDVVEGNQGLPSITVGPSGHAYVAWDDSHDNDDVYLASAQNSGESFSQSVRVNEMSNTNGAQLNPDVAVDNIGTVYVSYNDLGLEQRPDTILATRSTNLGATFEPAVMVDKVGLGGQFWSSIEAYGDGRVYVAWTDKRFGGINNVMFARSTDGGQTFAPPIRVADTEPGAHGEKQPDLAVDDRGNIYAVWEDTRGTGEPNIYFAKSTDGGKSFGPNVRVDDTGETFVNQVTPAIDVAPSGTIYVAWHDEREGFANFQVFVSRSSDAGQTFTQNVRVPSDGTGNWYPVDIAAASKEVVYVTWADFRFSDFEQDDLLRDVFVAVSRNGGASFSDAVRVADQEPGKRNRTAPSIAWSGGRLFAAWMDSRGEHPSDIYFTRSRQTTDGQLQATSSGTSSISNNLASSPSVRAKK